MVDDENIPIASVISVSETTPPPLPVIASQQSKVLLGDNDSQVDFKLLAEQGFPSGLAQSLERNRHLFPLRIWIVDNSGSMNTLDGHRFIETTKKNDVKVVPCTRWAEIQQTVDYHIQMSALALKQATIFRLLNDPGRINGPQFFGVCERGSLSLEDVCIAQETMQNASPGYGTPLTKHILEIRETIVALEPTLRENGTKVAVIMATDGLPSDAATDEVATAAGKQEFFNALRSLEGLPVWIVIRLCTDDPEVVEYYNEIDAKLELSIEVLDDFIGEAKEVYSKNKWLNYGLPLHRAREVGFHHKLFDLLDERQLSADELRDFFYLLFGREKFRNLPDPQADWRGFFRAVSSVVDKEKKQWNPVTKRVEPWVNMRKLKKKYGQGNCCIM